MNNPHALTLPKCVRRFRSIWISDVHLGARSCKSQHLLEFLRHHESDFLYLVGDIIDGFEIHRALLWTPNKSRIIQNVLDRALRGTKVFYLPGNHDAFMRKYVGREFGGISVVDRTIHKTVNGLKLLVMHGDEFCAKSACRRWLLVIGDAAYYSLMAINHWLNIAREKLKMPYWSLSNYLKGKAKFLSGFVARYERAMVKEACRLRLDGVICGHIHFPGIKLVDGFLYCNDGDWLDSCTALVEDYSGRLQLIQWSAHSRQQIESSMLAAKHG